MKRLHPLLAALLLAGSAAQAQMSRSQVDAFEARLKGWVRSEYPELLTAKGLSDRTMVAFVVDSNDTVLDRARGLQPVYDKPTPLVSEVERMLPKWKGAKFRDHGGACFGNPRDGSKYCVIFSQVAP